MSAAAKKAEAAWRLGDDPLLPEGSIIRWRHTPGNRPLKAMVCIGIADVGGAPTRCLYAFDQLDGRTPKPGESPYLFLPAGLVKNVDIERVGWPDE